MGILLFLFTRKALLDAYLKEECEGEYGKELLEIRRRIWEGLVPGSKLVTSRKGLSQIIEYTNLKNSDETLKELNARLILIYTGQRRLAKGILRDIMEEYIKNNHQIMECLTAIQRLAVMLKFELEKGNVDAFARLLNEHWKVSK
jgi:fucokinase